MLASSVPDSFSTLHPAGQGVGHSAAGMINTSDDQIQQLLVEMRQHGLLDDQFGQLLQLQDESNPNFIDEVIALYFDDSATKLEKLNARLAEPSPNYNEIDQLVHQLKGSSASFGARAIAQLCVPLREACHAGDRPRCQALTQQIQVNFSKLKGGLQEFMHLEHKRQHPYSCS